MANRWGASASELSGRAVPTASGLSSHPSVVAVNAAHGEVTAFKQALAIRVGTRATHVVESDIGYLTTEADSVNALASVADPPTSV
jgi:hypothetical protein